MGASLVKIFTNPHLELREAAIEVIVILGWTEIKISQLINCGILGADADICRRLLVPKN